MFICFFFYPTDQLSLWLQSDNTVKEIRNGNCTRICAMLCQQQVFTTSSHCHLMVGHTHEDVDGVLALVTSALNAAGELETPHDVSRVISDRLTPVFNKNGVDFEIEVVGTVARPLRSFVSTFSQSTNDVFCRSCVFFLLQHGYWDCP